MTKKWTKTAWKKLAKTPDRDLVSEFPGLPRATLRDLRRASRAGASPAIAQVREAVLPPEKTAGQLAEESSTLRRAKQKVSDANKAQKAYLDQIDNLTRERDAALSVTAAKGSQTIFKVNPSKRGREATAVALASDWHCEEQVRPGQVGGMNEFNLDIFAERAGWFFRNLAELVKKERQAVAIPKLVLWLGGDLISGSIHDDLMEGNALGPIDAAILIKATVAGGIEYLQQELAPIQIVIPCSSGNHGRITKKRRIATEQANSLEYMIYASLRDQFKGKKDVTFVLPQGYHTYLDIYGFKARFHHGHAMRYAGGVGGITIPVNKKIAMWNRLRQVDYDFFGHFHNHLDGGHWVCNGSLIGYGAFSNEIGAPFEHPKQAFCLIDKDKGKTGSFPIFLEAM